MATDRAIENAEKIIKLTEEREAQTQKIKDLLKDIDKLSGAALDKRKEDIKEAKIILQVKSKELKISQGLTDTQEELLSLTDKEAVLAFDIAGYKKQAKKTADQIRKLSVIDTDEARKKVKELKKQAAETHGMFKSKEKEISAAQANNKLQEKLLETIGLSGTAMSGLVAQARLFTLALLKNPLLLGAAALLGVVMALKKAVTGDAGLGIATPNLNKLPTDKPIVPHSTYPTQIYGDYFGGLPQSIPKTILFRDFFDKYKGATTSTGKPMSPSMIDYSFRLNLPTQKVDQQLVDEVNQYLLNR